MQCTVVHFLPWLSKTALGPAGSQNACAFCIHKQCVATQLNQIFASDPASPQKMQLTLKGVKIDLTKYSIL